MTAVANKPLSILVADDVDGIQALLREWLTGVGHQVACVAGGTEGSRLLRAQHFDLVIVDVLMPDGDGLELMGAYRHAVPDGRILAISGGGKFMAKEFCITIARGFGAHAVLEKPFTREQVLAAVDRALQDDPAAHS